MSTPEPLPAVTRTDWSLQETIQIGPFRFWQQDCLLLHDSCQEQLTPKACALLRMLVEHYPHAAPRDRILDEIWGNGRGSPETVAQIVAELRRKLQDDAKNPRYIRTISKVGFQLITEPVADGRPAALLVQTPTADRSGNEVSGTQLRFRWQPLAGLILLAAILVALVIAIPRQPAPTTERATPSEPLPHIIIAGSTADEAMPRFVPALSRIVYGIKNANNGTQDIAWMDYDGGEVKILDIPVTDEVSPAVSQDGKILAYVKRSPERCQVIVSDVGGQIERAVADCPSAGPTSTLDLSSDGQRVAFTGESNDNGSRTIKLVDVTSRQVLTESDAGHRAETDFGPRLSPDGESFTFFRWNHDLETREFRLYQQGRSEPVSCGQSQRITAHGWANDGQIWMTASNGLSTALLRFDPATPKECQQVAVLPGIRQFDVFGSRLVMAIRGPERSFIASGKLSELAAGVEPETLSQLASRQYLPRISPDERLLLHVSKAGSMTDLWVSDFQTLESRMAAKVPSSDVTNAQWLPDNRHVLVGANPKIDLNAFYLVDTLTGTIVEQWQCAAKPDSRETQKRVALAAQGRNKINAGTCGEDALALAALPDHLLELNFDRSGKAYAALNNQFGIFEVDALNMAEEPMAEYRLGKDWSWDISERFLAVATQLFGDGVSWGIRLLDRQSGEQTEIPIAQLNANGGIDLTSDGRLFFTLLSPRNADIAIVELPQDYLQ